MATVVKFEDLEVWRLARLLCNEVYILSESRSFEKDYKLRGQINGASGSIMDNIAEGFERDGKTEFRQFLSIAKGSCGEVRSQLYRAIDCNHITQEQFESVKRQSEELSKKFANFIKYLNSSELKGLKFKL